LALKIQREVVEISSDGVETVVRPEVLWKYGAFIQTCLDFMIIAVSIFVMIKVINRLTSLRKQEEEEKATATPEPAPEPEPTKEEILLTEIRDLLKEKR
jgi:large conductance mechanosensitive channel